MGEQIPLRELQNSHELFARAKKVFPGGVNSPVRAFKSVGGTPVFFKAAEGPYMTAVDGRRYIDFCQSFGPNILGHRDPDVQHEVEQALREAWTFGACEPYSLELAEWILQRLPFLDKIRFVCSGTEAVMSALRIARAATGKNKILKLEGCYHGHADSLLVKAGSGLAGAGASDSAGVDAHIASDTIVAQLDNENSVEEAFRLYGHDIAALILEPLPANFGLLIQRPDYLRRICEIARQHGALLIFDEVISGFRVGLGGMAEVLDIRPDLVTYGKVIGGGFPVGAYAGRAELMDRVAPAGPVYQAGTLAANPIGMRAGLAVLKKIEHEDVFVKLNQRTHEMVKNLNMQLQDAGSGFAASHYASLFWIHLRTAEPLRSPRQFTADMRERFSKLFHKALVGGVYLAPSAFEVGFVSYAHTPDILAQAVRVIGDAAKAAEVEK